MYGSVRESLQQTLDEIRQAGLWKEERVLESAQGAIIEVQGRRVMNFCANNYLGLSSHPAILESARETLASHGFGLSSVRFICGTQELHKNLEEKISLFLEKEETILFTSCWDANGGIFETLLSASDAVISDSLNHASIIDGVRLCKAERRRYRNADMEDLEKQLQETQSAGRRLIVTDGVFSMDGTLAPLKEICDLAERYNAMVMVDDSHATGFIGKTGRGTMEHCGVMDRVDIVTSTLGKALGGATGGFLSAPKEIVALLRQRARPYLFSNSLPPMVVGAALRAFELLSETTELRDRLESNTQFFRDAMTKAGFAIKRGVHPIVPIMLGDARLAHDFAHDLLDEGVYVIGFSYPVVPKGEARIRVQVSAAHEQGQLETAVAAFKKVGIRHSVVG